MSLLKDLNKLNKQRTSESLLIHPRLSGNRFMIDHRHINQVKTTPVPHFKAKLEWIRAKGLLLVKYLWNQTLKNRNPKTSKLVSPVNGTNQYSCQKVHKFNHEETSNETKLRHCLQNNWPVLVKENVKMKHEEKPRNCFRLKEMTSKGDAWLWMDRSGF